MTLSQRDRAGVSLFNVGDKVEAFGTDESTKWFATGNDDPYRVTGTILRAGVHAHPDLYKVEIDNSGSQDSEGHNAVLIYHGGQMRKLK